MRVPCAPLLDRGMVVLGIFYMCRSIFLRTHLSIYQIKTIISCDDENHIFTMKKIKRVDDIHLLAFGLARPQPASAAPPRALPG